MGTQFVIRDEQETYIFSSTNIWTKSNDLDLEACLIYPLNNGLVVAFRNWTNESYLIRKKLQNLSQIQIDEINDSMIYHEVIKPVILELIKNRQIKDTITEMDSTVYIISQHKLFQIIPSYAIIEGSTFLSANKEEEIAFVGYHQNYNMKCENIGHEIMKDIFRYTNLADNKYVVYRVRNKSIKLYGAKLI